MASIKISDFKGCVPKRSPKLLPENFAQTAEDCDLTRGKITSIKNLLALSQTANLVAAPKTVFKLNGKWFSWNHEVSVVKSDLDDSTERLFFTDSTFMYTTTYRQGTMEGAWFTLNAANEAAKYYVWIRVGGVGVDPNPDGLTSVVVDVLAADTAVQVAGKIAAVINALAAFGAVNGATDTVTITNAAVGIAEPLVSEDCPFESKVTTLGTIAAAQISTLKVMASPNPTGGYPIHEWFVPAWYSLSRFPLSVAVTGTGAGKVVRSVSYIHTLVSPAGLESRPSPPSDVVDVEMTSQITTITCGVIAASGKYFTIDTVSEKFYVWYRLIQQPVITVDFAPCAITAGEYFYFYAFNKAFRQDADKDDYYTEPYQQKTVVWYDVPEDDWDIETAYTTAAPDKVFYNGHNYKCLSNNTGQEPPASSPVSKYWERDYNRPNVEGDFFVVVILDGGATDPEIAAATVAMLNFHSEIPIYAKVSTTPFALIKITGWHEGIVKNAGDGGTGATITTSSASASSVDPTIAGRTGVMVDILPDFATANDVARVTAKKLNDMDQFSCPEPAAAVIVITNTEGGKADHAANVDVGFTVTSITDGDVQTVTLSFTQTPFAYLYSHCRVYRTVVSSSGTTEYQLVPPYEQYDVEKDYALGDRVMYGGKAYYCYFNPIVGVLPTDTTKWKEMRHSDISIHEFELNDFIDHHPTDETLVETIQTEKWDDPVNGLEGLVQFDSGIIGGFKDNNVYFAELFHPYAWPSDYMLSFPDNVVGLSSVGDSIAVLTEGKPFILTGSDPATLIQTALPFLQPCLSRRGIVSTESGVIYPCPDGLFSISMNGGVLISKDLFTKTQWKADYLVDTYDLLGAYHDDKCYFIPESAGTALDGFYLDLKGDPFIVNFNLNGAFPKHIFVDGDELYFLTLTGAVYDIHQWRAHATSYKTYTWKSKEFQLPYLAAFSCGRIIAEGATTLKVYIDGVLHQTIVGVTDSDVFRLTSGLRGRVFELELTGSSDVDFAGIAAIPMELSL